MMNFEEIMVVVAGLLFGYWAVSSLLVLKERDQTDSLKRSGWYSKDGPSESSQDRSDGFSSKEDKWKEWKKSESTSNSQYRGEGSQREGQREKEGQWDKDDWNKVLEVPESASLAEITKSYKKLMSQYHPDKVSTLGKELQALAEKKSKQINNAYDVALRLRNKH